MSEKLYKIMEQNSTGWHLHDTAAQNLTKEQCNQWLRRLTDQGANPRDLRAIFQNDTRYDNRPPLT